MHGLCKKYKHSSYGTCLKPQLVIATLVGISSLATFQMASRYRTGSEKEKDEHGCLSHKCILMVFSFIHNCSLQIPTVTH